MDRPPQPRRRDRIAGLIGAEPSSVVMGDTLSIKVYQALASALEMNPGRRVIPSDAGNFPSDLYMADGLVGTLGRGYELRVVAPEEVAGALDESVAVLLITEVDYRTGRRHDMAGLTARAHALGALTVWHLAHSAGALTVWHLAHSTGALPVRLAETGADFAVGCTYKSLNSGPGGPAFIYVAPATSRRHGPPSPAGWAEQLLRFIEKYNDRHLHSALGLPQSRPVRGGKRPVAGQNRSLTSLRPEGPAPMGVRFPCRLTRLT